MILASHSEFTLVDKKPTVLLMWGGRMCAQLKSETRVMMEKTPDKPAHLRHRLSPLSLQVLVPKSPPNEGTYLPHGKQLASPWPDYGSSQHSVPEVFASLSGLLFA